MYLYTSKIFHHTFRFYLSTEWKCKDSVIKCVFRSVNAYYIFHGLTFTGHFVSSRERGLTRTRLPTTLFVAIHFPCHETSRHPVTLWPSRWPSRRRRDTPPPAWRASGLYLLVGSSRRLCGVGQGVGGRVTADHGTFCTTSSHFFFWGLRHGLELNSLWTFLVFFF